MSKGFSDHYILREDTQLDYKVASQPACSLYSFYLDTMFLPQILIIVNKREIGFFLVSTRNRDKTEEPTKVYWFNDSRCFIFDKISKEEKIRAKMLIELREKSYEKINKI